MRNPVPVLLVSLLAWSVSAGETARVPAQWLVVAPPALRETLAPLIKHRRDEGLKVGVVDSTRVASAEDVRGTQALPLQAHLNRLCQEHPAPTYLLLVGHVPCGDPAAAQAAALPAPQGKEGRMNGQPTDHAFGRPDSNSAPAVAVGRFPARNAGEARDMVAKTLRFERDARPGAWRHRVVFLGGNPGGGRFAEMLAERATAPRLKQLHPFWTLRGLVHNPASCYYLPHARWSDTARQFLEEGALMSAYLGHSNADGLWSVSFNVFPRARWGQLNIARGAGPLFTAGCYSCQYAGRRGEGYGLAAMRNPTGPVAVMGAHGETYGAPGQLAVDGLLRRLAAPPVPARLGDYWLSVKEGLARGYIDPALFTLYDAVDGSQGKVPLPKQRLEHLEMWTLLGDPALRLAPTPLSLRLDPQPPAGAGSPLIVRGTLPPPLAGARVRVTLERPVGLAPAGLDPLPDTAPEHGAAREQTAIANHRKANDVVVAAATTAARGTRFECALDLPAPPPPHPLVIRGSAMTDTDAALGVMVFDIKTPH
ncbi:MAG: hypothetical protein JXQ71_13785 [Verrucomicrobia bacterium]|nr:hypothetical protein [Verrucomicrobiota bacterium]